MGEIADGVINGDFCEMCLMPTEYNLSFPHKCSDCQEKYREDDQKMEEQVNNQDVLDKLKELKEDRDIKTILTESEAGIGFEMAIKAIESNFNKKSIVNEALEDLLERLLKEIKSDLEDELAEKVDEERLKQEKESNAGTSDS